MNTSKINFVRILSGLVVVLGLILLGLAITAKVASQSKPAETPAAVLQEKSNFTVEYNIVQSAEQGVHYVVDLEGQKTVFDVLKKLADENNFDMKYNNNFSYGVQIESIVDIKDGTDGKYWMYYVNGKLGDVAADKKEVKVGDKVEWRFEKADY